MKISGDCVKTPEDSADVKVKKIHAQDLAAGYSGTFMPEGLLEKKYKNCANELIWQWFFPAMEFTEIRESRELRGWHVFLTAVGKEEILSACCPVQRWGSAVSREGWQIRIKTAELELIFCPLTKHSYPAKIS